MQLESVEEDTGWSRNCLRHGPSDHRILFQMPLLRDPSPFDSYFRSVLGLPVGGLAHVCSCRLGGFSSQECHALTSDGRVN